MRDEPDDFGPTASLSALEARSSLLKRLRAFFDRRGFLEVDTPLLSGDTVVDPHIDPLRVTLFHDATQPEIGRTVWLQTSPEFAMKRLLAAGAARIYQITHAFRGGESGERHNPEFTIVEWYRVGDGMREGIGLLRELACEMLDAPMVDECSYRDAFLTHAGFDPHVSPIQQIAKIAAARNVSVPHGMNQSSRDEWLNLMLAELVEPRLGTQRPLILYDYPATQAALAQLRAEEPPVAERFKLYVDGLELANGYHELLDAEQLMTRNRASNQLRTASGRFPLPEDSRLLAAMRHGLPSCAGVALGFDRLLMAIRQASHIREVIPFPIDRA